MEGDGPKKPKKPRLHDFEKRVDRSIMRQHFTK